jgi:SH3-like domain-containing protein
VRLRAVPSTAGPVIAELDRATPLRVLGAMREWRRVQLTDGRTGFIAARLLEGASLATN